MTETNNFSEYFTVQYCSTKLEHNFVDEAILIAIVFKLSSIK